MDSITKINHKTCGFTIYWRIENFKCKPGRNFSLVSPMFKIKALKSKWYIETAEEDNNIGVYLFKASNPSNPMWSYINFAVSLLTGSGWITYLEKLNYKFRAYGAGNGIKEIVCLENLKNEKWNYLPNGSLTISVRIWNTEMEIENSQCLMISRLTDENELHHRPSKTFSDLKPSDLFLFSHSYDFGCSATSRLESINTKPVNTQLTQTDEEDESKIGNYFLKFFKEKKFTFVTLRTGNQSFFVPKAVLCANSPVFEAMFSKEMKEKNSNYVDIDDIDSQTMALVVDFLHYGSLEEIKWDTAVTLYYAADKYQIEELKDKCVSILKKELSLENICDAFLLADLHEDEDLMDCAQEYFLKNSKFIFLLNEWKDLLLGHPELVSKILYKLGEKM